MEKRQKPGVAPLEAPLEVPLIDTAIDESIHVPPEDYSTVPATKVPKPTLTSIKKLAKPFSKVREAREAIVAESLDNYRLLKTIIAGAAANGDYETAAKSQIWLMEHTPAGEDGLRPIAEGIDKVKQADKSGPIGPVINIGLNLGGVSAPKEALPSAPKPDVKIIDITGE